MKDEFIGKVTDPLIEAQVDFQSELDIRRQRGAQYGNADESHENTGLVWTGLIQNHYGIKLDHPLSASLVEIMMAGNKLNRMVTPNDMQDDDYLDGRVYIQLAREARRRGR